MSGPLGDEKQASPIPLRQHEDESAHLRQEGSEQQPQRHKIVGTPMNGAPAHPCHELREVGGVWFGLSEDLVVCVKFSKFGHGGPVKPSPRSRRLHPSWRG
jgi:hypothetical protein